MPKWANAKKNEKNKTKQIAIEWKEPQSKWYFIKWRYCIKVILYTYILS